MEFIKKLFQKKETLKMCRVKYLSGKEVICPASIATLSELLMTCSAGTEIEVLGQKKWAWLRLIFNYGKK